MLIQITCIGTIVIDLPVLIWDTFFCHTPCNFLWLNIKEIQGFLTNLNFFNRNANCEICQAENKTRNKSSIDNNPSLIRRKETDADN